MTEEQSSATRDEEQQDQPQDTEGSPKAEGDDQESSGADSAADQEAKGGEGDSGDEDRTEAEAESDEAKEEIKKLEEEGPPEKLEDWPTGKAKYETFGGPEGEHSYSEGPEEKMGPADVRHREDGSVEVHGEKRTTPRSSRASPSRAAPRTPIRRTCAWTALHLTTSP